MSFHKIPHLDEDQLLMAVVDEASLPVPAGEHLKDCPQCRDRKSEIDRSLAQLGRMSARLSPLPRQRSRIFDVKPGRSNPFSLGWPTALGTAMAVGFMILLVWWSGPDTMPPENRSEMIAREMEAAENLMSEISDITENALSPVYLDIAGESYSGIDDEFILFIVPSTPKEPLSSDSGTKGVTLC